MKIAHEFLFSLNVALGLVLGVLYGYDGVFVPFIRLYDLIYREWGFPGGGDATAGYLVLSLFVILVTALLFTLLLCLRLVGLSEYMLIYAAGFLALGVAPACWLYLWRINFRSLWSWCPIEPPVYFLLAILFLWSKWSFRPRASLLIVGAHYGFWFFLFWEYRHNPVELLVPTVGFCACLAWGMSVLAARARPERDGVPSTT